MTTPTPEFSIPADLRVIAECCKDDGNETRCTDLMIHADAVEKLQSDLAAALEENAKLKAHAEAMAVQTTLEDRWASISAYRRDFPKEGA